MNHLAATEDGHTPVKGRKPTVKEAFPKWLDSKTRLGPGTRDTYESQFRRRVEPVIGSKQI